MELVFTFHSTHGAIGGERSLLEGGLKVKVMALPSSLGAGCGLCLRLAAEDLAEARRLLAEAHIEPEGLYQKIMVEGRAHYQPMPATADEGC